MKNSSNHPNTFPSGPLVSLPAPFVDARGAIQTLVEGGIHSVQVITSRAGTVRANHYHKSDSHYMYVVSGAMRYYFRPAGAQEPPRLVLVGTGQMVFTPPLVEHAVHFPEDTVFLNLTSEPRDQSSYEEGVVRVELFRLPDDAS